MFVDILKGPSAVLSLSLGVLPAEAHLGRLSAPLFVHSFTHLRKRLLNSEILPAIIEPPVSVEGVFTPSHEIYPDLSDLVYSTPFCSFY
jgi:hypothetical protein